MLKRSTVQFTLSLLFLIMQTTAFAQKGDTTVIEYTDKGIKKRITILTQSDKKFEAPKVLNLDNILTQIGVDTNERKRAIVLIENGENEKDTILVFDKSGDKIKIIAKNPFPQTPSDRKDTTVYENETEDRWATPQRKEEQYQHENDRKGKEEVILGKRNFFPKSDFGLYFGVNNWNSLSKAPFQLTNLRNWSSRYVALSFRKNATLVNSEKTDLALSLGPEIAWYNFMFENNNKITYVNQQVRFVESFKSLTKSKLVVPYLNFPVLLNLGFEESKVKFGLGGYIGYRVGGYSKTKDSNGVKTHEKSDFGMTNFLYGFTAEAGRKNSFTIFVRYDMSDLFKSNQTYAQGLSAWSIGLRI